MFELRRLTKTVKKYQNDFTYQLDYLKENIDEYIEDLTYLIDYTNELIASKNVELDILREKNIDLFCMDNSSILSNLYLYLYRKVIYYLLEYKSKTLTILKRYNHYFKIFLERLERTKFLCNL